MQLFDIAIGRCRAIEGGTVTIGLDSAIVSRLVPGYPWRMSGTSVLRLSQRLCSKRFPLEPGRETFLQREELMRNPSASLDLLGDGNFVPVRLRALSDGEEPQIVKPAAKTPRSNLPQSRRS